MDYTQDTTKHTKGKHFSYGDRRELQGMLSNKSVRYSLRQLARHFTITMDYTQDTTKHTKGKHFSYGDRRELQGMLSNKSVRYSLRQLARHFNCAPNTIVG